MVISKKWMLRFCAILYLCVYIIFLYTIQKSGSVQKIWNGYEVLAVPTGISENEVLTLAAQQEISNIISISTQPSLPVSMLAPVQNVDISASLPQSYEIMRSKYFYDQDMRYQLYYIPDRYAAALSKVQLQLEKKTGMTVFTTFQPMKKSYFPAFICSGVFVFLILLGRHKLFLLAGNFLPVLSIFFVPEASNGSAVCLLFYIFYLLQDEWYSKIKLMYFIKNPFAVTLGICSFAVCCFTSVLSSIFFLSTVIAALLSTGFAVSFYKKAVNIFEPIPITESGRYITITTRMILCLTAVCGAIICLYVSDLRTPVSVRPVSSVHITIPVPQHTKEISGGFSIDAYMQAVKNIPDERELPALIDYVAWIWNETVFPFRKLGGKYPTWPMADDIISIPTFNIENNRINEQMKTVYIFDQAFLRGLIEPFKGKKTDSIESLLVRQDKFVYTVYASLSTAVSSADTKQSSPAIFAVLISVLTILCIFIVGKRNDRYF